MGQVAERSVSMARAGPRGTSYCCGAWGTLVWEHPGAHPCEDAQTGLILLLLFFGLA